MKGDPIARARKTVEELRRSGEVGHHMERHPFTVEQRERAQAGRAAYRRRVEFGAEHRHDRGAVLPSGTRTCWGCHVRERLERWYLKRPDLAPEVGHG